MTEEELIAHIYEYGLLDIVKNNPTLSVEFITNYILNPDFQLTQEEGEINIEYILKYQPHIKYADLTSKRKRGILFDFEKYMN